MSTLKSFLDQYEAENAALMARRGAPASGAIAPSMHFIPQASAPAKETGGLVAAAKRAVGGAIQGTGQLAADFLPGIDQGNALQQYGKEVVDANAPAITSLGDIAERPGMAVKEATGNVAGSVGTALGLRALGQGISAVSALGGPLGMAVGVPVGQAVSWGAPILAGLLPSFGGIRERQIEKDPNAAGSVGSKLTALGGATAVGAIEKFGPEGWATAALNKDARKALIGKFSGAGTLQRMGMAGAKGAAIEGVTEMVQNPIEQMASGDNPLDPAALKETLFAGAMGAIGGGTVGSMFGVMRDKPANTVSDDDLKGGIDEALAPPAAEASAEPMAEDYARMQREFETANQPQGTQYPGLAEASTEELQRMAALLETERGKKVDGAAELKAAVAQEFAARQKAAEPTLAERNDAEIDAIMRGEAVDRGADLFGNEGTPHVMSPLPHEQQAAQQDTLNPSPATDLTATAPLFDATGRASPEVMVSERGERPAQDMTADEVAARLQEAAVPRPAGGQAALMAGQLPTPSPIVIAPGGGTPVPVASLKGLPVAAKNELSKHMGNPEQLAAAVADMFYSKAGAGSSAAYVFDKLPALYQQLTGQPLPETPAAAPAPLQQTALPFELQGETQEQAAANYRAQAERAAAQQPLPVIEQPRGKQQSTFLDRQGEIDLIQPGMSRRESAAQRRAREFAVRNKAARQKAVAETLGTNIPETTNAVQKPVAAKVDEQQPAQAGKQVAKGDAQGTPPAAKGQAQAKQKASVAPIRSKAVVAQGDQDAAVLAAMAQMSQEEEAARAPEQEIIDTLENNFNMELSPDERTMLTARLKRAKTEKERVAQATSYMQQAVKNKQAAEKASGKATRVDEGGSGSADRDAGTGAGTDRVKSERTGGRAARRAAAPAERGAESVAVETGAAKPAAGVAPPEGRQAQTELSKSSTFTAMRNAYENATSGPAGKEARMNELTGIAELELTGESKQSRALAQKYLDSNNVNAAEAAAARREAQDWVARQTARDKALAERDAAVAKAKAELKKQLSEMQQAEGPDGLTTLARKIESARITRENQGPGRGKKLGWDPQVAALWDAKMEDLDRQAAKVLERFGKDAKVEESSADAQSTQTYTPRELAEYLVEVFGEGMRMAILTDRVRIAKDQVHLAAALGDMSMRGSTTFGGYVHGERAAPGTGYVFFVAGNLTKEVNGYTPIDVALHEIGEHAGMETMLGKEKYARLLAEISRAMAVKKPQDERTTFEQDVAAAMGMLRPHQKGRPHEVLAYMIQHTPDSTGLQKMWSAIKAWVLRYFGMMNNFTLEAQTMRSLARGAARKWLRDLPTPEGANPAVRSDPKMSESASGGMTERLSAVRDVLQRLEGGKLSTNDPDTGFDALAQKIVQAQALAADYPDMSLVEIVQSLGGQGVVYGRNGFHRYSMNASGQIMPIKSSFGDSKDAYEQAVRELTAVQSRPIMSESAIGAEKMREVFGNFRSVASTADAVREAVSTTRLADMAVGAFERMIGWFTKHHLRSQFDAGLNGGLSMNILADTVQETTTTFFNQMFNKPYHQFVALERTNPDRAAKIGQMMRATELKLDPRKSWDAHTHLHQLEGEELRLARKYHNEYAQIWGLLNDDERALYNDLAAMNEAMYTAELAVMTYNMVRANPAARSLAEFQTDPTEKFRASASMHSTISATKDYWRGVLDSYTAALDKFAVEQRGMLPQWNENDPEYQKQVKEVLKGVTSDRVKKLIRSQLRTHAVPGELTETARKIRRHLSPIEAQLRAITETTETFSHAPYFHLGRFGDQFVSFRVRMTDKGLADPAAMEHVQKVLAEHFPQIVIRYDTLDPHVFARLESVGESQKLVNMLRDLQKQGWLQQLGKKEAGKQDAGEIVSGSRADILAGYSMAGPNWLTRVVESVKAEGYDPDTEQQLVAHMRSLYLDSLPDTAAIKVKQHREGRPGWDADMLRAYAHRMRIGSNRVGSLAAEPIRTESFAVMKDAIHQMQVDHNKYSEADKSRYMAVMNEFERRNQNAMNVPHTPGVDMLRAANHAYFLGMSPSYVLIQLTQLGVLTWPELAKKHGFVKAAKAIGKVTGKAMKLMRVVIEEGYKQRGFKGAADMVITGDLLEKAGLSADEAEFLIKVMASGKLDIGNASREIGRVAQGAAEGTTARYSEEALRVASAFGYASETLTRTITALAARELYKKDDAPDVVQYAIETIDESMLNYTTNNIARMTGKHGAIGRLTPVMFSFMQYQFQLLEKLYREFYTAYSSNPSLTDKQREEAKQFLGAHLTSMFVLAGTLGMPFFTVIAAAADKLCDVFGEGYCDTKAAMRNMTSNVFGSDIEPIISKGLPRALGFDVSERAGEANIAPFSRFIADKREMDERFKQLAVASWGAPSSMVANIVKGFEKIGQGDLLGGMMEGVPLALRGPVKAYEMSEKGYVDKAGNALPMSAGAWDMALQAFGLNPGEKADYQQAKFMQSQRAGVLGREATRIRQKLASAIERQDREAMREWFNAAQEFDLQNPTRAILPNIGSVIKQRARIQSEAKATGMPVGVSPKDFQAMSFTSFMQ